MALGLTTCSAVLLSDMRRVRVRVCAQPQWVLIQLLPHDSCSGCGWREAKETLLWVEGREGDDVATEVFFFFFLALWIYNYSDSGSQVRLHECSVVPAGASVVCCDPSCKSLSRSGPLIFSLNSPLCCFSGFSSAFISEVGHPEGLVPFGEALVISGNQSSQSL